MSGLPPAPPLHLNSFPSCGVLRRGGREGAPCLPTSARKVSLGNQLACLYQGQSPYFSGRNPTTSHFLFFGVAKDYLYVEFLLVDGMLLLAGKETQL